MFVFVPPFQSVHSINHVMVCMFVQPCVQNICLYIIILLYLLNVMHFVEFGLIRVLAVIFIWAINCSCVVERELSVCSLRCNGIMCSCVYYICIVPQEWPSIMLALKCTGDLQLSALQLHDR